MNRRSRHRRKIAEAREGNLPRPQKRQVYDFAGFEGGRMDSTRRGFITPLPLDTAKELTGGARLTMLRNCRWLAANNGYAKMMVRGLANLIGYYSVQPATTDKEWNRIVKSHWCNRTRVPAVFDRAGKVDFRLWQLALSRSRLRDGDLLSVLTSADSGAALVQNYEAHQIDDGMMIGEQRPKDLQDGVFVAASGRHKAYRIVDANDPKKVARVPAEAAIYYSDFDNLGTVRGISIMAHAVTDLLDMVEIDADAKLGIKRKQWVGLYRKRAKPAPPPGGLFTDPTPTSAGTTTTADGVTQQQLVNVESVYQSGGIPALEEGEDFGVIESDQPGPNEDVFNKRLLHKIALGAGLPASTLFAMAGQTGPEVRFHMALTARWIEIELLRLQVAVSKYYAFWLSREIQRGALPLPDDENYWSAIYIPTADLTIDRGREGRLALEELKLGATTLADIWEAKGGDWEEKMTLQSHIIQRASEIAAADGQQLSQVLPGWGGTPNVPPSAD